MGGEKVMSISSSTRAIKEKAAGEGELSSSLLGLNVGLEIQGLDLSNALDPTTVDEIQNLLLEKQFLTFPNQDLTPARVLEIAKRFGHPEVNPIQVGMPHHPEIIRMAKRASEPDPLLSDARTIGSFYAQPSKFVFAYCDDPSVNSDIICSSMTEAWNGLSKPIQDFLEPLTALHSAASVYAPNQENTDLYVGRASSQLEYSDAVYQTSEHPIVHTHPDTGLRSLFINPAYTQCINEIAKKESCAILDFLWQHCARPEFGCRIVSYPKTLSIWDNRVTTTMLTEHANTKARLLYMVSTRNEEAINPSPIWPTPSQVFT
jgi:taurine dioxygenase